MTQHELLDDAAAPTPPDWLERYDPKDLAERWPQTLAETVDVVMVELRRRDFAEGKAIELAEAIVMAVANHQGGRAVYLPRGARLALALRDRLMWQQFPRKSISALALEYNLTERRVEQILAEQRAMVIRRIQPGLFPDP